jgi:hypothetical protein
VTVNGREIEIVDRIGRIDLDDIAGEIEGVGAEQVWWSVLAAHARHASNVAKLTLDTVRAELGREKRKLFEALGQKITEAKVDEEVNLDTRFQAASLKHFDAIRDADIAEGVKYVCVQKARSSEALAPILTREREYPVPAQAEAAARVDLKKKRK